MISTVSAIIYFLYLKFCPLLDVVETIGPECLSILKSICENKTVATIVAGYFILVLFAPEFANRLPGILSIPLTCIFNVMLVSNLFRSDSYLGCPRIFLKIGLKSLILNPNKEYPTSHSYHQLLPR